MRCNFTLWFKNKVLLFYLLLMSWCSFSQTQKMNDTILLYGISRHYYLEATDFVGKRWGIEVRVMEDCSISEKLADSILFVNQKVWEKWDSILGLNAHDEFRKQTLKEMKKIAEAQKIFESNRKFKKRIKKLEKIREYVHTELDGVSENGEIYYWSIYRFDNTHNPDAKWQMECKFEVNILEEIVVIIEIMEDE